MRIVTFSDLHLDDDIDARPLSVGEEGMDASSHRAPTRVHNPIFRALIQAKELKSLTATDLVCIAGDVAEGIDGIGQCLTELRNHTEATIVGVMGNHDYAEQTLSPMTVERIQSKLPEGIHLLENQKIEINGVRILGCTLWTNPDPDAHETGSMLLPEYMRVSNQHGDLLSVDDTLVAHLQSKVWLNTELAKPFDGKTVVVTHHAPSFRSQPAQHRFRELSGFFCVAMEDLIDQHQPNLWIHGHLHEPVDYAMNKTRIVSAPLGYADERWGDFCPLVVEL